MNIVRQATTLPVALQVEPTLKKLYTLTVRRVARWPVFHRPGRYFTAKLAEAGKRPVF